MRIAMVGTRGLPARYGGFETCVDEVGTRLVKAGHAVTVYCRQSRDGDVAGRPSEYHGMTLVHLPALKKKSLETLSHTALSTCHLIWHRADVALVFNSANSPFVPVLRARGIPVGVHVDGLEWQRAKWRGLGKRYYRLAESMAVRWGDALIADARGIADYYRAEFDAPTELIAYGAPRIAADRPELLEPLDLRPGEYHLVVARFEPENHVDVIVDGYRRSAAKLPLVVIGSAPYADDYTARIKAMADDRVRFLGGVWDQEQLDQLYANCATYLHGHSVGGTNPSLLRAIGAGAATIAFDVIFNREVLQEAGRYFTTAEAVRAEIELAEQDRVVTRSRGVLGREIAKGYDWDDVAQSYDELCRRLAPISTRRRRRGHLTGRRRGDRSFERTSS